MPITESIPPIPESLIHRLSSAESIVVLTGSGVSAESGVPTFRDAQTGLWAQYDPLELATPAAFEKDPLLVWEWYEWRRQLVAKALPNPAHDALAQLEHLVPQLQLITQNIDGLHHLAGSKSIIELHGNISRTKCYEKGHVVHEWNDDDQKPPRCPHCQGLLRPDVVWFGEALLHEVIKTASNASQNCDLFFSVGTSSVVQPAATLPEYARHSGAYIVEINVTATPLTPFADLVISGPAGQIIPKLVELTFHK